MPQSPVAAAVDRDRTDQGQLLFVSHRWCGEDYGLEAVKTSGSVDRF
jgi:hypothetical protein